MSYIDRIKDKVKSNVKTIVLPESNDERIVEAAGRIMDEGIAKIILLGNNKVDNIEVIDPTTYPEIEEFASRLVEIRQGKLSFEEALNLLRTDYMYFAVMLVECGYADGVVSGACHSTADTLRPALQILRKDELTSSFFIMESPIQNIGSDGLFIFADCGLVQAPDSNELAAIAKASADSFERLISDTPRIAMLSHSTLGSAKHEMVDRVIDATNVLHAKYPELVVEGEVQVDAALSEDVAKKKGDNLSGKDNVLIFPNIDAGNIGYKLVQIFGQAKAYGPLTQGLKKPVNDLSRGCSVEDIVTVVAITAYQSF